MRIVKYINGKIEYRDATTEEVAEMKEAQTRIRDQETSTEDRLSIIEDALELILSGATE